MGLTADQAELKRELVNWEAGEEKAQDERTKAGNYCRESRDVGGEGRLQLQKERRENRAAAILEEEIVEKTPKLTTNIKPQIPGVLGTPRRINKYPALGTS